MRRATLIFLSMLMAAVLDTTLIPTMIPGPARPNLALIVASVWAALGAPYGYIWVFIAGLLLDVFSAAPTGMFALSLLGGNLVARVIEAAPIPVEWFRVSVWVALVTVIAHSAWIAFHRLTGQMIDLSYATQSVILPALVLNPLISIPVYLLQSRILAGTSDKTLGSGI
ncbi:MAG TPA: rod shape-determining protein MreD [Thermoflexales bacterium]|nr:rod shape-determining protein MreD [Thermoflexales bacterium]HQW34873.1 rod shape-determining protein MreD [Thermoflexales bacterium]HQX76963.1 rod shape-determining protein MreD [Thermoflexales bacterium]HQZ21047.1 rod shape-determining protein MreD [Thermoflexales bacterium]HQZ98564.1 rod shape-determining protein MreD [Thermoflexales bacterium]